MNTDYKKFELDSLTSNDFCYFDPPYYLGDASYNENDGWNEYKEKELLEYINKVNKHGIKFALSNVTEHKGLKNEILIDWAIENQYNIHNLNYNYSNSNYHLKDKNEQGTFLFRFSGNKCNRKHRKPKMNNYSYFYYR